MFCPLCYSEYRPQFSRCKSCGTDLVNSLRDATVVANARRLLWIGKDHEEFDLLVAALREAQIPMFAEEGGTGLLGPLLRPNSKIYVLESEMRQGLTAASIAIRNRKIGFGAAQTCSFCFAACSAGFSICPSCSNTLKPQEVETERAAEYEIEIP